MRDDQREQEKRQTDDARRDEQERRDASAEEAGPRAFRSRFLHDR